MRLPRSLRNSRTALLIGRTVSTQLVWKCMTRQLPELGHLGRSWRPWCHWQICVGESDIPSYASAVLPRNQCRVAFHRTCKDPTAPCLRGCSPLIDHAKPGRWGCGVERIGHYRPYMKVHELLWHQPLRHMDTGGVRKYWHQAEVRPRRALYPSVVHSLTVAIIILRCASEFTCE